MARLFDTIISILRKCRVRLTRSFVDRAKNIKLPTLLRDVIEFQPEIDEIEHGFGTKKYSLVIYVIAVLCVVVFVVSYFCEIDTVVIAHGRLDPRAPTVVIQPLERSILRSVHVRTGQIVRKGDILAELDPTFVGADFDQSVAKLSSLKMEVLRLESEWSGKSFEDTSSPDGLLQSMLFSQRKGYYEARISQSREKIDRLTANYESSQRELEILNQQIVAATEVLKMREALFDVKSGSKLNVLDSNMQRIRIYRDIEGVQSKLVSLKNEMLEAKAEERSFVEEWRQKVIESLVSSKRDLMVIEKQLDKQMRMKELSVMTSPIDGVVMDVVDRSAGSVLREAEPIVTLIPTDDILDVYIEIVTNDIGYIVIGDKVRVKIDAYSFQRHGILNGTLTALSGDAAKPVKANALSQAPEMVYRATVVLDPDSHLDRLPSGARLLPGMELSAEIKVGKRTILSYFIFPLLRGLNESIREP